MTFDYAAAAELFIPKKGGRGARQPLSYRRFPTATEAIRFAVEEVALVIEPPRSDARPDQVFLSTIAARSSLVSVRGLEDFA